MGYKDPNDPRRDATRASWYARTRGDPEKYAAYLERRRVYTRTRNRVGGDGHAAHLAGAKRRQDRRTAELAAIKVAAGCVDCGYNARYEALHFDHLDPATKVRDMARMRSSSWEVIWAEIAKCVVRCANCHAIRSAEQRREYWAARQAAA